MGKEQFREFVATKPELASYVNDGTMTWQKFYELYDLYGESNEVWNKYLGKGSRKLSDFMEKFDPDSLQKNIESFEKAIDVFKELTNKAADNIENNIKPDVKRPLTKFFGD